MAETFAEKIKELQIIEQQKEDIVADYKQKISNLDFILSGLKSDIDASRSELSKINKDYDAILANISVAQAKADEIISNAKVEASEIVEKAKRDGENVSMSYAGIIEDAKDKKDKAEKMLSEAKIAVEASNKLTKDANALFSMAKDAMESVEKELSMAKLKNDEADNREKATEKALFDAQNSIRATNEAQAKVDAAMSCLASRELIISDKEALLETKLAKVSEELDSIERMKNEAAVQINSMKNSLAIQASNNDFERTEIMSMMAKISEEKRLLNIEAKKLESIKESLVTKESI